MPRTVSRRCLALFPCLAEREPTEAELRAAMAGGVRKVLSAAMHRFYADADPSMDIQDVSDRWAQAFDALDPTTPDAAVELWDQLYTVHRVADPDEGVAPLPARPDYPLAVAYPFLPAGHREPTEREVRVALRANRGAVLSAFAGRVVGMADDLYQAVADLEYVQEEYDMAADDQVVAAWREWFGLSGEDEEEDLG